MATEVVEHLLTLLHGDRAMFVLIDAAGEIEHIAHRGFGDWKGWPSPIPVSHTIVQEALTTGDLVCESDGADLTGAASTRASARSLDLRFLFAIPVYAAGHPVGVLYVDSRQSQLRQVSDIKATLAALAHLVGAAAENALLWEELAFTNLLLARTLHEMSQPVTAVHMAASELHLPGRTRADALAVASETAACATRMAHMIGATMQVCRPGSARTAPTVQRVDLSTIIADSIRSLEDVRRAARHTLRSSVAADLPAIDSWPDRIRAIVSALLLHGLLRSPPGSAVRVEARRRPDRAPPAVLRQRPAFRGLLFRHAAMLLGDPAAGFIDISIVDSGPTPSPADIHDLLQPWPATAPPSPDHWPDAADADLTLVLAEQLVRSLGGRAWVEAHPEGGRVVHLALPVRAAPR